MRAPEVNLRFFADPDVMRKFATMVVEGMTPTNMTAIGAETTTIEDVADICAEPATTEAAGAVTRIIGAVAGRGVNA